jgi:hypothetical protein
LCKSGSEFIKKRYHLCERRQFALEKVSPHPLLTNMAETAFQLISTANFIKSESVIHFIAQPCDILQLLPFPNFSFPLTASLIIAVPFFLE